MAKYELTTGVVKTPVRAFIYGPEGIGKSTLAAQMPDPVFIDIEGGTNQLPVARMPRPTSWAMLLDEVKTIRDGQVPCASLVIDTADAAEALCVEAVCKENSKKGIEEFGYGRGYTFLLEKYGRLIDALTEVTERGRNVVILGHSRIEKFERPDEQGAYDRFAPKLTDTKRASVSAMVKEWADMVLFLDYKTYVVQGEGGKAHAQGGQRIVRTTHAPTWEAKNRFGLPDEMPLNDETAAALEALMTGSQQQPARPATQPTAAPAATAAPMTPAAPSPAAPASPELAEIDERLARMEADVEAARGITGTGGFGWPSRMRALEDLMVRDGVSEKELQQAVASRKYFPASCPPTDYDQKFVDWIVAVWPTFMQQVEQLRTEEIPF